ncbi:MAG: hypothetical protein RL095_464 [Verrucomicrobiota bacterium]|jgi:serine/threonine protein kinase
MDIQIGDEKLKLPENFRCYCGTEYKLTSAITNGVYIGKKVSYPTCDVVVKFSNPKHNLKYKRFHNEIATLEKLSHKNISKLYGNGILNCSGLNLEFIVIQKGYANMWQYFKDDKFNHARTKYMQKSKFEKAKFIIDCANDILESLDHLHSKGFIHRDIKPANFVFQDNKFNSIFMIDLGLSKYTGNTDDDLSRIFSDITEHDEVVGPRNILSPELIKYSSDKTTIVDYRSDLWQFSRVLWFLVTGELSTGRPSKYKDPTDGRITEIVDGLLHENPDERSPSSINEIKTILNS